MDYIKWEYVFVKYNVISHYKFIQCLFSSKYKQDTCKTQATHISNYDYIPTYPANSNSRIIAA